MIWVLVFVTFYYIVASITYTRLIREFYLLDSLSYFVIVKVSYIENCRQFQPHDPIKITIPLQ